MNVNYYKFVESRKKEVEEKSKRKQEYIGLRRQERKKVLDELLEKMKDYHFEIKLEDLKRIVEELKEKEIEKTRRFC